MGIRCLFGHKYSVVHPDNVCLMSHSFAYMGVYAICERCRKRIDSPSVELPMLMPTEASWTRYP